VGDWIFDKPLNSNTARPMNTLQETANQVQPKESDSDTSILLAVL
jgi:hypothetical protein